MWRKFMGLQKLARIVRPVLRKSLVRTYVLLNSAQLIKGDVTYSGMHFENPTDIDSMLGSPELKVACTKNDEAIRHLIKTLNYCIEEICEQYQHCIVKQIEITLMCMNLDPVGGHWDELTKYRVEASDLRTEFEKYSLLVERIGQIVHNQVCGSVITGNSDEFSVVESDYQILKEMITIKNEENKYWDGKLLDVNKQSILKGVK